MRRDGIIHEVNPHCARVQYLEGQVANLDPRTVSELSVDRTRPNDEIRWVDAGFSGPVETDCALIPSTNVARGRRRCEHLQAQSLAQGSRASCVVGVRLSQEQFTHAADIETVGRDLREDTARATAASRVDQCVVDTTVDKVNVAVVVVGETQPKLSTPNEVDVIGDPNRVFFKPETSRCPAINSDDTTDS